MGLNIKKKIPPKINIISGISLIIVKKSLNFPAALTPIIFIKNKNNPFLLSERNNYNKQKPVLLL